VSLRRISLTQNKIVNQVNIFFIAGTSWSAAIYASLLTALVYANFFSSLLMLLFVQHLFENLFVNFISLYPFFK